MFPPCPELPIGGPRRKGDTMACERARVCALTYLYVPLCIYIGVCMCANTCVSAVLSNKGGNTTLMGSI